MAAYYNEIDPQAAQWLRNLIAAGHIAPGDVDARSIVSITGFAVSSGRTISERVMWIRSRVCRQRHLVEPS